MEREPSLDARVALPMARVRRPIVRFLWKMPEVADEWQLSDGHFKEPKEKERNEKHPGVRPYLQC